MQQLKGLQKWLSEEIQDERLCLLRVLVIRKVHFSIRSNVQLNKSAFTLTFLKQKKHEGD